MGKEINHWPITIPADLSLSTAQKQQLIKDTLFQIEKDIRLQGIELKLNTDLTEYTAILEDVSNAFENLRLIEDPRLTGFLYQLDLNQSKISRKLTRSTPDYIYNDLAESVIKKCFEKVCWRLRFKG